MTPVHGQTHGNVKIELESVGFAKNRGGNFCLWKGSVDDAIEALGCCLSCYFFWGSFFAEISFLFSFLEQPSYI